jgi:hypothetical protein
LQLLAVAKAALSELARMRRSSNISAWSNAEPDFADHPAAIEPERGALRRSLSAPRTIMSLGAACHEAERITQES